jgi:hypothetical protein
MAVLVAANRKSFTSYASFFVACKRCPNALHTLQNFCIVRAYICIAKFTSRRSYPPSTGPFTPPALRQTASVLMSDSVSSAARLAIVLPAPIPASELCLLATTPMPSSAEVVSDLLLLAGEHHPLRRFVPKSRPTSLSGSMELK